MRAPAKQSSTERWPKYDWIASLALAISRVRDVTINGSINEYFFGGFPSTLNNPWAHSILNILVILVVFVVFRGCEKRSICGFNTWLKFNAFILPCVSAKLDLLLLSLIGGKLADAGTGGELNSNTLECKESETPCFGFMTVVTLF